MKSTTKKILLHLLWTAAFTSTAMAASAPDTITNTPPAAKTTEASGENLSQYTLTDMIVEGNREKYGGGLIDRKGSVGILGEKDSFKVPFTVTNLSQKTIDTFGDPTQPLDSILANSPSIRQSGSILHNDFTFRGFRANGTSCYVNGVPGIWTQFNAPTHVTERVEIVAGPNSGLSGTGTQYESDTAGGLVNFVTKRAAEKDFTRYTQTVSGRSLFGEYLDMSRRWGDQKEWGLRINLENVNGQTNIPGEGETAKSIFINLDHRGQKSITNFFTGYRDIDITNGQRWFKLGSNVTRLPAVPDPNRDYSFDGMDKGSYGWVAVLNHEQYLNRQWKVFLNAGYMQNKLNKNIMYQNSAITLNDNLGNFDVKTQSTTTPQDAYYIQLGTTGKFTTGNLKHELTIAADQTTRTRDAAKNVRTYTIGSGNIYTGQMHQTAGVNSDYESALSNITHIWGGSIADSMDFGKWNVLLGIHKHNSIVRAYNTSTGRLSSRTDSDAACPTYAVSYSPIDKVAFYASHAENFNAGSVVGATYKNSGEILPPAKTKQNEIGIKYLNKSFFATLSLFDIKQANTVDVTRGSDTYQTLDGELQHKGIELAVNTDLTPKWSLSGGLSYMRATYQNTTKGLYNGITESGRPNWTGVATVKYAADKNFDIIGRAIYVGSAPVLYEKFQAPSYVTIDLGLDYKTKVMGMPAKFSLMCYNLLDKKYWMIARGDNLYLSNPRTVALTMSLDF